MFFLSRKDKAHFGSRWLNPGNLYVLTQNTLSQHDTCESQGLLGLPVRVKSIRDIFSLRSNFKSSYNFELWTFAYPMNLEQKQPFLAGSKESLSGTRNVLNTRSEKLKEGRERSWLRPLVSITMVPSLFCTLHTSLSLKAAAVPRFL